MAMTQAIVALPRLADDRYVFECTTVASKASQRYRPVSQGIMGTVEIAFWGEPSTNLSLIAR
jgi:hypothetical protein